MARRRKLDLPPSPTAERDALIGLAWLIGIIILMMLAG